jgi:hypothetical protein
MIETYSLNVLASTSGSSQPTLRELVAALTGILSLTLQNDSSTDVETYLSKLETFRRTDIFRDASHLTATFAAAAIAIKEQAAAAAGPHGIQGMRGVLQAAVATHHRVRGIPAATVAVQAVQSPLDAPSAAATMAAQAAQSPLDVSLAAPVGSDDDLDAPSAAATLGSDDDHDAPAAATVAAQDAQSPLDAPAATLGSGDDHLYADDGVMSLAQVEAEEEELHSITPKSPDILNILAFVGREEQLYDAIFGD